MQPSKSFKDLRVWQEAFELCGDVYDTTKIFPKDEMFGLTSQMRRAAVSVCSNIAEGFGRSGSKEKDQFYAIAYGSLLEIECQTLIAKRANYISDNELDKLSNRIMYCSRMLINLQKSNKEKGVKS